MTQFHSKLKGLVWMGVALGAAVFFARGLPAVVSHVPWSLESWMANRMGIFEDAKICREPTANLVLQKVLNRLGSGVREPNEPGFPLSVEVIKGKEINAFATLGGRIYVLQGLLNEAQTPDELAGVLAHEIEHVRHRDIIEGSFLRILTMGLTQFFFSGPNPALDPRMAGLFLNLHFTREQEARADEEGIKRLSAAGISAAGFAKFFERLETRSFVPDLVSDHPASSDRAAMAKRAEVTDSVAVPALVPVLDENEWRILKKICD